MRFTLWILMSYLTTSSSSSDGSSCNGPKRAKSLIPDDYNAMRHPPLHNGPVEITADLNIVDVYKIDEIRQEIDIAVVLAFSWVDSRIVFDTNSSCGTLGFLSLDANFLQEIWKPDVIINHARVIEKIPSIVEIVNIRVYAGSRIYISLPINLVLGCQMNFRYHPLDTQFCIFQLKPYGYRSEITHLRWTENVQISEDLLLSGFDLKLQILSHLLLTQRFLNETYSSIAVVLVSSRKLSQYLLTVYLPNCLFLIVSWLSLLVPPEHVPGRMSLCVTNLLAQSSYKSYIITIQGSISYLTATDVWQLGCQMFALATVVEFSIIINLAKETQRRIDKALFYTYPALCLTLVLIYWVFYLSVTDSVESNYD